MVNPIWSAEDEGSPQLKVEQPHKKADASLTKQQNISKANTLSDAKDRAQLTATTAMSVVHIALLRSLLGGQPSGHPYYHLVLSLIGISLVLQVIAGMIALLIAHTKVHHKMHIDQSWSTFCSNLCRNFRRSSSVDDVINISVESKEKVDGMSSKARDVSRDHFSLMQKHDELTLKQIGSSIAAAEATINLKHLRDRMRLLMSAKQSNADVPLGMREKIDAELYRNQAVIMELETKVRFNKIIHEQYDIISDITEDLREHYILQRVTFWQQIINYMLYFIFVINSFITGLGVSGHGTANETSNS